MPEVIPVYKKGARGNVLNYRGLSVYNYVVKIFEKGVYIPIMSHLEDNKLITKRQYKTVLSNIHYNNMGTPPEGILGPLLFLLYVNDLPDFSSTQTTHP